jgi:DNA-binding transcriptional MocR family regulator
MTAAERYDRAGKLKGARNGPLGAIGLEVLRELLRLIDYRTGRLEPSIETLMTRLKRSKDAVVRALKALRACGFVDWLRRYVPANAGAKGPQLHQTSNAYRLSLPPEAAELVPLTATDAPAPDDDDQARAQARALVDQHLAQETPEIRNAVLFGKGKLADLFTRIEHAVARRQRESAERALTRQDDLSQGGGGECRKRGATYEFPTGARL